MEVQLYENSNMTPSAAFWSFSLFGLVFFLGIMRQKGRKKCVILSLNPSSHVRISIYQMWAVNPPRHQILRIDRGEMIDGIILRDKRRHLCQKCSLIPIAVYST